jgi:teichuronic acid biosynthesis glycosyltransferase TuaC
VRILAVTHVFPNRRDPHAWPYQRQQFAALAKRCELTVLVPVPPSVFVRVPREDVIDGVCAIYIPTLASLAPHALHARRADVILGTCAYPDACAALVLARSVGRPAVVKVHGADLDVVGRRAVPRAVLRRLLPLVHGAVAVSRPLAERLTRLGVPRARIHVVPNGVDRELFTPQDRNLARRALGVPEPGALLLFVGRLEREKGVRELLDAFVRVRFVRPDVRLALVGDGPMLGQIDVARVFGGAVMTPGKRPPREVSTWLAACDALVLPSWHEGTPNAVLEALASGRPVVASYVGGIPEVVRDSRVGRLVPPRDAVLLADALLEVLEATWDPTAIRAFAPGTWDESAGRLYDVLALAAGEPTNRPAPR